MRHEPTRRVSVVDRLLTLMLATGAVACSGDSKHGGWKTWNEGPFEIRLPPQFAKVPVQGIDSLVGRFVTPDDSVSVDYDFGAWSNDLVSSRTEFTDFSSHREGIDREEAFVVTGTLKDEVDQSSRRRHVIAATWQEIGGKPSIAKLTIWVTMDVAKHEEEMLEVLRSVTFRRN